jgi:hypothetical protein
MKYPGLKAFFFVPDLAGVKTPASLRSFKACAPLFLSQVIAGRQVLQSQNISGKLIFRLLVIRRKTGSSPAV